MVTGTEQKLDLMGKLWILFQTDLPERKKRFPSWAGAEKFAVNLNLGEKKRHSCCDWSRTPTDRSDEPFTSFYERNNSGYAIKPKKSVKRQTDTKTQWNTMQVSLFYSFHLRKSKV